VACREIHGPWQHRLEVFDTLEVRQSLEEEREVSEGLDAIGLGGLD
jgi:hypothetical protein